MPPPRESSIARDTSTPPPGSSPESGRGDTRDRLLDAAERLFAERGFEGATMRALARGAGASLSSTNYHFGTKEALLEAVLRRRVAPLNALRIDRLAAAREAAGDGPIPVESILAAYVGPFFERRAADRARSMPQPWAAARLFFDPAAPVTRIRTELLGDVEAHFIAELARTLPHRARYEIEVALRLTTGMLVHFSAGHVTRGESMEGQQAGHDAVMQSLLAYARAGWKSLEEGLEEAGEER